MKSPSNSPACSARACATICCRRSARSTTASNCSPTSRIRRCASAASSCSPKARGPSANKLKFFRLAFGAGGRLRRRDRHARGAGRDRGPVRRRRADPARLDGRRADKMSKAAVKVLLNLGADRRRRAGARRPARRRRRAAATARSKWSIRAEGPRILLDPELRETHRRRAARAARSRRARRAPGSPTAWPRKRGGTIQVADRRDGVLMIGVTLPPSR